MTEKDLVIRIIQLIHRYEKQNLSDGVLQEIITNIIKELKKQIIKELKNNV